MHFTGGSSGELRFIAVSTAGAGVITLDTFDTPQDPSPSSSLASVVMIWRQATDAMPVLLGVPSTHPSDTHDEENNGDDERNHLDWTSVGPGLGTSGHGVGNNRPREQMPEPTTNPTPMTASAMLLSLDAFTSNLPFLSGSIE